MKEIFRNIDPRQKEEEAELERLDIDKLRLEFEETWGIYRKSRILINTENEGQKELTIYAIPVDEALSTVKDRMVNFTMLAMILGHRSALASILLAQNSPNVFHETSKDTVVFFFLERTI